MRLVSIINAWKDTIEFLPHVIKNHLEFCEGIIVIWSSMSNKGVSDGGEMLKFLAETNIHGAYFYQQEPVRRVRPLMNETHKRNIGLNIAKQKGFTHYIIADTDEFYIPQEVENDKKRFEDTKINGLVCAVRVYVGKPTLYCKDRNTLIPFIHKLKPDSEVGKFPKYPMAYIDGVSKIDPSRRPNATGIQMTDTVCHHFSYVRKDIKLKISNSTANLNRMSDRILRDVTNAHAGYHSELYSEFLIPGENEFNLPVWQ